MTTIRIGDRKVGTGQPCFVIAEIGINHNGDLDIATALIAAAKDAGCDAVKFQKRTVDVVYTPEELAKPRESRFGKTNGDLKRGLEFARDQYDVIDRECRRCGIQWFASCWDEEAVDFIGHYGPPAWKVASASLTDDRLLDWIANDAAWTGRTQRPVILSTGMSDMQQVDHAVGVLKRRGVDVALLHCVATYPARDEDLNLYCIETLRARYGVPVGYSGHEIGIATSVAAVVLGACIVERHFTLNRSMWGSDQAASIEPQGMARLVRDIRAVEAAMGDGVKRVIDAEIPIRAKLRRVG